MLDFLYYPLVRFIEAHGISIESIWSAIIAHPFWVAVILLSIFNKLIHGHPEKSSWLRTIIDELIAFAPMRECQSMLLSMLAARLGPGLAPLVSLAAKWLQFPVIDRSVPVRPGPPDAPPVQTISHAGGFALLPVLLGILSAGAVAAAFIEGSGWLAVVGAALAISVLKLSHRSARPQRQAPTGSRSKVLALSLLLATATGCPRNYWPDHQQGIEADAWACGQGALGVLVSGVIAAINASATPQDIESNLRTQAGAAEARGAQVGEKCIEQIVTTLVSPGAAPNPAPPLPPPQGAPPQASARAFAVKSAPAPVLTPRGAALAAQWSATRSAARP